MKDNSGTTASILFLIWVVQTGLRPQLVDPYTWQWGIAVVLSGFIAACVGICSYQWWIKRGRR